MELAKKSGYRPDIDGLRAIAILAVVLFHANIGLISSGYVGVDIFFVISGFLIGGIIFREVSDSKFSFAHFYARRFKRILPPLIVIVVIIEIVSLIVLSPSELKETNRDAVSSLLGLSNINFWLHTDYFAPNANLKMLVMTWSLGVEEQFYAIVPFVMIFALRYFPNRLQYLFGGLIVVSWMLCVKQTYQHPATAFYLLPARAWELSLGVILAIWRERRPQLCVQRAEFLSIAGSVFLVASVLGFDRSTPFPGLVAGLPVLGTALLLVAEKSLINRYVLSCRPLVFIGLISYSWYLWHWPAIALVRVVTGNTQSDTTLAIIAALSLIPAYLSWRFVEVPCRKDRRANGDVLIRYASAVVACLALAACVRLIDASHMRTNSQVALVEGAMASSGSGSCLADWGIDKINVDPSCRSGASNAPIIVIIGDSHAGSLGPEVRNLARENGMGFQIIAKSSCRPLLGVSVWRKDQPTLQEDCATFMESAFSTVAANPNVRIVLLAGLWAGPLHDERLEHYVALDSKDGVILPGVDLLSRGLRDADDLLVKSGKTVVVVGDTPHWNSNPVNAMLNERMAVRRSVAALFSSDLSRQLATTSATDPMIPTMNKLVERISTGKNTFYLDTFDHFCDRTLCSYMDHQDPLFVDTSHLSLKGAEIALADLRPIIRETISTPYALRRRDSGTVGEQ